MENKKTIIEWTCDECGTAVSSDKLPTGWCRINEQKDINKPYDSENVRHLSSKQCLKKYVKKEADEKETNAIKKYYV